MRPLPSTNLPPSLLPGGAEKQIVVLRDRLGAARVESLAAENRVLR